MGSNSSNHLKEMGIQPNRSISKREYSEIWTKYDKNRNRLTLDKAGKFMKDFSEAVGVQYDKEQAKKLIQEADVDYSGYLNYEQFKKLFFTASKQAKVTLTYSLLSELNEGESSEEEQTTDTKKPLNLSQMKEFIEEKKGETSTQEKPKTQKKATMDPISDMFNKYLDQQDASEEEVLKENGMLKYSEDLGVTEEKDPTLLLIAWKLGVNQPVVWEISREEFNNWSNFGCKTISDMKKKSKEWRDALKQTNEFKQFYYFCFDYIRESKKILKMEEALILWDTLDFPNRWPLMNKWVQFVTDKGTVTRDQWRLFYNFTIQNPKDLSTFVDDGSWPSIIDDFVAEQKKK